MYTGSDITAMCSLLIRCHIEFFIVRMTSKFCGRLSNYNNSESFHNKQKAIATVHGVKYW